MCTPGIHSSHRTQVQIHLPQICTSTDPEAISKAAKSSQHPARRRQRYCEQALHIFIAYRLKHRCQIELISVIGQREQLELVLESCQKYIFKHVSTHARRAPAHERGEKQQINTNNNNKYEIPRNKRTRRRTESEGPPPIDSPKSRDCGLQIR